MKTKTTKGKPAQQTYTEALSAQKAKASKQPGVWQTWMGKLLPVIITVITLITLGGMLFSQESEMLYRSQELSLFLPTQQFFESMQIYPGGTLQWLACWCTQFFYHPLSGVLLLCGCWAIIIALCRYNFRLKGWNILFSLPVIILLMTCIVQTGYWVYYTKLQGYFFVPTLGILISLAAAAIYRLIERRIDMDKRPMPVNYLLVIICLLWMGVFAWKGYENLGAWSFLGVGVMALPRSLQHFIRNKEKGGKALFVAVSQIFPILLAGICIYLVPKLAYDNVYCQTQIDTIYRAAMPSFQYSATDNDGMRGTYYVLFLMFIPLIASLYLPERKAEVKRWRTIINRILLVIIVVGGPLFFMQERWYRNENFQKELIMNRCIEEENWQGVLDVAPSWTEPDTLKQPTRAMVMMKNLALFRMNKEGDEMFNYLEGAREQRMDSLQVRMTQVGGKLLYYNYGKLNFCYRWCMEDGVEFGWKVEHLRFMARCALLKGEWKVAEKYLNILKQTRYHREWAEKYAQYVGHPELMEKDPGLAPICKLKEFGDRLDGDNTLVELYLLRTYANGHGVDPIYQKATLMCSLIMKDIDLFWPRLVEYIHMHGSEPNFHLPRHYQEAAYLYSMLEPNRPSTMWPGMTNAEAMQRIPFDESVKKSYNDFMNFNGRADIAPLPEAQKRIAFQPYYGNTFYYFYFLVRGQKTN